MASRIGMRMQLMREQVQQEEQRERLQMQHLQYIQQQHLPVTSSPAISTPVNFQPPPQVPLEVLKVQTHLENPTSYHLQQSLDKKLRDYFSDTYGNKFASQVSCLRPPTNSPAAAAVSSSGLSSSHVISSSAGNSAPNSPMAMLNIRSNPEREMDDVIDHIMSLDDVFGFTDPAVSMPNNLLFSSSHTDLCSDDPRVTASVIGVTSNSCPPDLSIKRELTDAENRAIAKERQKKDNHNLIERRRRFNINDRIKELGTLIPKVTDLDVRWNKGTILKASVDYIRRMQKEQQRSREVESQSKRLEMTNKQLWLRIQELEMQAQLHGLPTSSPSGINTAELAHQFIKQEMSREKGALDPQPHMHSPYQELDFGFSSSAGGFQSPPAVDPDTSFPSLSRKELDLMLLDDSLLPLAVDPVISAMSSEASKASSRRSSYSMDDSDVL
ncbi:transcription factor EB [Microcaecilia unicolor]|uniref:Transcription factor EB n=1 Tax=Microcaecilia unicolor TaxID=1415580 RepID=A0A6P7ZNK9_9AMPH|nr:transcription factor EB [Microcaecilia unicolor]XP_030076632.1 transcription factor EB [Microcaecilia unicolor]